MHAQEIIAAWATFALILAMPAAIYFLERN